MGVYGNIVIAAAAPPARGLPKPKDTELLARSTVACFERHGLIVSGSGESAALSREPKGPTLALDWIDREPQELGYEPRAPEFSHISVDPDKLLPKMAELVYLVEAERFDDLSPIDFPYVHVTVLDQEVSFVNGYDLSVMFRTWAAVEFSYGDVRLHDEIHRIRDDQHPVVSELTILWGAPVGFAVVPF